MVLKQFLSSLLVIAAVVKVCLAIDESELLEQFLREQGLGFAGSLDLRHCTTGQQRHLSESPSVVLEARVFRFLTSVERHEPLLSPARQWEL